MKDTRVETANEGVCIIIPSPTERMIQQVAPLICCKTKHQVSKCTGVNHTEKSDRAALASTLCIKMQICLRNRFVLFLSAWSDTTGKRIESSFFKLRLKSKLTIVTNMPIPAAKVEMTSPEVCAWKRREKSSKQV
jgi:hypothetical protein